MLQRDEGTWWVACDVEGCSEAHDLEAQGHQEAVQELREAGWRTYKDDADEWCNMCPSCREEVGV